MVDSFVIGPNVYLYFKYAVCIEMAIYFKHSLDVPKSLHARSQRSILRRLRN